MADAAMEFDLLLAVLLRKKVPVLLIFNKHEKGSMNDTEKKFMESMFQS